jgi:cystathionine beta-lyase/cystathionine gamma-synthase
MSSPFDCWLASRGLMTLHLRVNCSAQNARVLADHLQRHPAVTCVRYPELESHPDQPLVRRQLSSGGWMVTWDLAGGLAAVRNFLRAVPEIPFCPSLGEVGTTISHPTSTSHRGLDPIQLAQLGVGDGTLRLSVGTESDDHLIRLLDRGLAASEQPS